MDGYFNGGNSTNGSLVSTLLQLSSQVDFMDQFLSMVHPAEYTHLKNLVSNNQQQRIAAVILQSPVTMVTPPSGTSAMSSSVNHFEHNLNTTTTTNGMCNGSSSSSSLVHQLVSNIAHATGNNQMQNSLPAGADGSLKPPVAKKRRGRKRKLPMVEDNSNSGNVASASNSNLQLGIGNRGVNDQSAIYYLQANRDQVWVPVTTTTMSANNAGASKTESNCQQNEVSNSCSISSSSQSTPTTTEFTGLDLLFAAVSTAIKTQDPTNAPVSTSTGAALISNSENISDNLKNSNRSLLEYTLKQSGMSHEEVQSKIQRVEITEMETSSQEKFQRNLNEEVAHLPPDCEQLMSKELNQPGSLHQSPSSISSLECSTSTTIDMSLEEYSLLASNPDHEIMI